MFFQKGDNFKVFWAVDADMFPKGKETLLAGCELSFCQITSGAKEELGPDRTM